MNLLKAILLFASAGVGVYFIDKIKVNDPATKEQIPGRASTKLVLYLSAVFCAFFAYAFWKK